MEFLKLLLDGAIILVIGALVSWLFFYLKRRDLFGGYIGGLVIGVIGALIGVFILDYLFLSITKTILTFLVEGAGINVIAGIIGAYITVYIMNRLGHNKERKKF